MTITFLDLYNEVAGQPWSMFDNDAESNDDLESSLKISINKAVSYVWNLQPWFFREATTRIRTRAGKNVYDLPIGLVKQKTIDGTKYYYVKYDNKFLEYKEDYETTYSTDESGEPSAFYIDGDKLYIYPSPDNIYTIEIDYLSLAYATNIDEEDIYAFKDDTDILKIPEKYEELFKNCVISLAMMYAIADESDENYTGYLKQYEDALDVLREYCSKPIVDRYIKW